MKVAGFKALTLGSSIHALIFQSTLPCTQDKSGAYPSIWRAKVGSHLEQPESLLYLDGQHRGAKMQSHSHLQNETSVTNQHQLHVFELGEEVRVPRENKHRKNA